MIINGGEWWHKIIEYYFRYPNYHFGDDPNLTFQEYVLINTLKPYGSGVLFDLDSLNDANKDYSMLRDWRNECVAHYYQPAVIDRPWDEVLNDKKNIKIVLDTDENGFFIDWHRKSPYKEWYQKELEEDKEKIRKWEEEKAKKRDYQRARRARIKEEKVKNNVK